MSVQVEKKLTDTEFLDSLKPNLTSSFNEESQDLDEKLQSMRRHMTIESKDSVSPINSRNYRAGHHRRSSEINILTDQPGVYPRQAFNIGSPGHIVYSRAYSDYNELSRELQAGDAVFFKGSDFFSRMIRRVEGFFDGNGYWSHTGMVVDRTILPSAIHDDQFYIFEAILGGPLTDGVLEAHSGELLFAVQLRNLKEVVENQTHEIGFHHLLNPLTEQQKNDFESIYNKYNHRPYDTQVCNLLGQAIPIFRFMRVDNQKQVCSELVASIYRDLGILPITCKPEDVTPINFLGYDGDRQVPDVLNVNGILFKPQPKKMPSMISRMRSHFRILREQSANDSQPLNSSRSYAENHSQTADI